MICPNLPRARLVGPGLKRAADYRTQHSKGNRGRESVSSLRLLTRGNLSRKDSFYPIAGIPGSRIPHHLRPWKHGSIIKKYSPWLSYWVSEPDAGQSDSINRGLKRVSGDFATWINGDDLLSKNALVEHASRIGFAPDTVYLGNCS